MNKNKSMHINTFPFLTERELLLQLSTNSENRLFRQHSQTNALSFHNVQIEIEKGEIFEAWH